MCWSAKWRGDNHIHFGSIHSNPNDYLTHIYSLIDEADVVCHYNGTRFDMPTLNKEFLLKGWAPPSTYKQIDLLRTARKQFKFPSNKLDYIAKALKVGKKVQHKGHQLWVDCLNGDEAAWTTMEEYNKQDVVLLEAVYDKLLPWIPNHPNLVLYTDLPTTSCPTCGHSELVKRGFSYTASGKFQRYRCSNCGSWHRDTKSIFTVKTTKDKNG
jgi:DNA polymerase elongation subunit (family B)